MSHKYHIDLTLKDDDTFPLSYVSLSRNDTLEVDSKFLFPVRLSGGDKTPTMWGLGINYSYLKDIASAEGIKLSVKKKTKDNFALIYTPFNFPFIDRSLSLILHAMYELDGICPLDIIYDDERWTLKPYEQAIPKLSTYYLYSLLIYSSVAINAIEEDVHEDDWKNFLIEVSIDEIIEFGGFLADDYLLEKYGKAVDPRLVEIDEWLKKFDVNKITHFSSYYSDIDLNTYLMDKDRKKEFLGAFRDLDIIEFVFNNLSFSQIITLRELADISGSLIIPLYCLYKKKNSTFFASCATNMDGMLAMDNMTDIEFETLDEDGFRLEFLEKYKHLKDAYSVCFDFNSLMDTDPDDEDSLVNLVKYGESKVLEFKATAKYSLRAQADDKKLYYGIIKNICAMANTDGGVILVGYDEDNQSFVGIEKDGFKNNDKWENYIRNKLKDKAGNLSGTFIDIRFIPYRDITCAQIEVKRSNEPCLCKELNTDNSILYVRTGASTRALDAAEIIKYSKERF